MHLSVWAECLFNMYMPIYLCDLYACAFLLVCMYMDSESSSVLLSWTFLLISLEIQLGAKFGTFSMDFSIKGRKECAAEQMGDL